IKMTRSKPVSEQEAPWLYRIVRELTQKSRMPMPKLYIMPAAQPNAFATGRDPNHAAVAVTQGILDVVDERELEGVLAHELSHVLLQNPLRGQNVSKLFLSHPPLEERLAQLREMGAKV